jgi:hypothetical protein
VHPSPRLCTTCVTYCLPVLANLIRMKCAYQQSHIPYPDIEEGVSEGVIGGIVHPSRRGESKERRQRHANSRRRGYQARHRGGVGRKAQGGEAWARGGGRSVHAPLVRVPLWAEKSLIAFR